MRAWSVRIAVLSTGIASDVRSTTRATPSAVPVAAAVAADAGAAAPTVIPAMMMAPPRPNTFVDIDGVEAETHFTVVHRAWRGRGLGIAVKAASVLTLAAEGVTRFRTGGSVDNVAILRANDALGYVRDEEWVTLAQNVR